MEEIKLVQSPIIKHELAKVGANVTKRIADLNIEKQVATDETIKTLKDMRAALNKEAKEFEAQRKIVKDAVMNPYDEFEAVYKAEIIDKYKAADGLLKTKVNDFEMKIKTDKRNALIDYFKELIDFEDLNWLTFDRMNIEVGLSVSEKKYKEQLFEAVGKIVEDLELIKTETYAAEILVEYKKTLNASQAITMIRQRKESERLENERILAQRTSKRIAELQNLDFTYSDIAKAYYWTKDNTICVSLNQIEAESNEDWSKRYAEIESKIKMQEQPKVAAPLKAPIVENTGIEKAQVGIFEHPKEEIFEARFSVKGTMEQLTTLGEYLKINNYQYQNL